MVWIILVMFIGLAILFYKLDDDCCGVLFGASIVSLLLVGASIMFAVVLTVFISDATTVDERIAMYEEENKKIEQQITVVVENYQEYEKGIFTEVSEENAMTLVTMYPELKSDSLVSEQIKVYVENNQKIKELREEKIAVRPYKWWLYFGG